VRIRENPWLKKYNFLDKNKASRLVGQASQAFGKGLSEIFAQAFFQKACLPVISQATPAYAGAVPPKYNFLDSKKPMTRYA